MDCSVCGVTYGYLIELLDKADSRAKSLLSLRFEEPTKRVVYKYLGILAQLIPRKKRFPVDSLHYSGDKCRQTAEEKFYTFL
jgi:hypothetical protein